MKIFKDGWERWAWTNLHHSASSSLNVLGCLASSHSLCRNSWVTPPYTLTMKQLLHNIKTDSNIISSDICELFYSTNHYDKLFYIITFSLSYLSYVYLHAPSHTSYACEHCNFGKILYSRYNKACSYHIILLLESYIICISCMCSSLSLTCRHLFKKICYTITPFVQY